MSAPMVKTKTPGIYKRGSRYVVTYRHQGKLRKESCRTLEEARQIKAERTRQIHSGEFSARSRVTLREYALEWIDRYQGRGGQHGFRESTRNDYRSALDRWILKSRGDDGSWRGYFPEKTRLSEVTPQHVNEFIQWLSGQTGATRKPLADQTIRNAFNPLRALFASAVREGLLRSNPTVAAALPHRPRIEEEEPDDRKPLTREQLSAFLAVVHPRHRLLFRLIAGTGLRIGEALALQWKHLRLDGEKPVVRVRRTFSPRTRTFHPPKSRHGRRDNPLDAALVLALRGWRKETEHPGEEDLVFPSRAGSVIQYSNLLRRVVKPAMEEAGAPWAGVHSLRHTFASLHVARGTNVVQLSRLMGHHSASFTLDTYSHLLDEGVGAPLSLTEELAVAMAAPVAEVAAA
jgi:integrase